MTQQPTSAEIERVAIAIYVEGGGAAHNWEHVWEPARERWRRHARAAIEALRDDGEQR